MLPKSWKPTYPSDLVRLGSHGDGGYVVSRHAVGRSDTLLSMGLGANWEFEQQFMKLSKANLVCFDSSVDRRFWALFAVKKFLRGRPHHALHYLAYRKFFSSERAEHHKTMIGYDGTGSMSLSRILESYNPHQQFFLKIDIEGWEYRIFDEIVENQMRFTGIAMELHDIDLHKDRVSSFLSQMNAFQVVYLTANNCSPCDDDGDPTTIEISLSRKDCFVQSSTFKVERVPGHTANDPGKPMINVVFDQQSPAQLLTDDASGLCP